MKFSFSKCILIVFILLAAGTISPGTVFGAGSASTVRVLCYGDSNTYGYDPDPSNDRYAYSERWTGILQNRLGVNYQILEEGKNGRATGYSPDGRSPAPEEGPEDLVARLDRHQPVDILVIMLGTNDCVPGMGLRAEDVAAGMETLVSAVEAWSDQTGTVRPEIVITVPPAANKNILRASYAAQDAEDFYNKTRKIGELYQDIADRHNCLFADARSAEVSELDNTHLTKEGHKQVAELLLGILLSN